MTTHRTLLLPAGIEANTTKQFTENQHLTFFTIKSKQI